MKKSKRILGKVTEQDLIKNAKEISREIFGLIPSKLHKNKKKYSRKVKHREFINEILINLR